ncbi:hypothetical protein GHT06_013406 [Daphnia sinensis]|uniref:Uncharacterized protein n=1 Tax=Daphnia sinensis TaxID=1820382 RepID=A0AAD5LBZ1_9CRUS|nr:hypothetical protein GHT06_013406 [Daphnia sinensis]
MPRHNQCCYTERAEVKHRQKEAAGETEQPDLAGPAGGTGSVGEALPYSEVLLAEDAKPDGEPDISGEAKAVGYAEPAGEVEPVWKLVLPSSTTSSITAIAINTLCIKKWVKWRLGPWVCFCDDASAGSTLEQVHIAGG